MTDEEIIAQALRYAEQHWHRSPGRMHVDVADEPKLAGPTTLLGYGELEVQRNTVLVTVVDGHLHGEIIR